LFVNGISLQKKYQHYYLCTQHKNTKNYRW
jgi:hypothetical protein